MFIDGHINFTKGFVEPVNDVVAKSTTSGVYFLTR